MCGKSLSEGKKPYGVRAVRESFCSKEEKKKDISINGGKKSNKFAFFHSFNKPAFVSDTRQTY